MSDETYEVPAVPPVPPAPDGTYPVPGPERRRGRRLPVVLAAVAGLVLGGGGVGLVWALSQSGGSEEAVFTLKGTMTLTDSWVPRGEDGTRCAGYRGYDDIGAGTSVTVYDAKGGVVAAGSLGVGVDGEVACVFPVSVSEVPAGSKFYAVEISHRGKLTVSAADAQAGKFAATLG